MSLTGDIERFHYRFGKFYNKNVIIPVKSN